MRGQSSGDQILIRAIRREIEDLGDIPQIAIELVDEGEISCCPDTGGEIEYVRSPWRKVVWVGARANALEAVKRVAAHQHVRGGLRRGIKIAIHGRGHTDLDAQRKESAAILRLLGRPIPHSSKPLSDQIIYHAALSANGVLPEPTVPPKTHADERKRNRENGEEQEQTDAQKSRSHVDGAWSFEPGQVNFMGQGIKVGGIKLKILRALVEAKRTLLHDRLVQRVWPPDSVIERQTIHTHLSKLREILRAAFKLQDEDPIPAEGKNDELRYKLDIELLKTRLSQN